ncbi:hypothetical protein E0Z10_g9053 [Xylaria hypoxylon]|uniref:Uncharacterized protein n=1 Tax=Xylaria hypoxylon TaxID=37992 RepID=A0A4Z0Y9R6_9PEZI|nr:hypothetical protein E0Z10_g9053 [Xylaria hypoxylon]
MFIISPYIQHQTAIQPSDALPKVTANKQQLYKNRSSYIDSSETLRKPIAFPNPPRPPTPGPPTPNPPVPPHPPVPTPPPSPHYLLSYNIGPQTSILTSRAEPSQRPYPNPPPSPGPRRPRPVRPRPDVPTPPPSPPRSTIPWVFSTTSNLVAFALVYLTLATWSGDTDPGHVRIATEDDICSKRHSNGPVPKPTPITWDPLKTWCQQAGPKMPSDLAYQRKLYKESPCILETNPGKAVVSDIFMTELVDDGLN